MVDAMKRILSSIVSKIAYCSPHRCEILGTSNNGTTYDVRTEEFGTIHNARVIVGMPNTKVLLLSGSKAWLTFEGGKPDLPVIFGFDQDTVATKIDIGGESASSVVRRTDIMTFDGTIGGVAAKGKVEIFGTPSKVKLA